MTRPFTVDREKVFRLFESGWSRKSIAQELQCSITTVKKITLGMETAEMAARKIRDAEILRLAKDGWSDSQIAKQFRLSKHTVLEIRRQRKCFRKRLSTRKAVCPDRDRVLEAASKGLRTLQEIADETGKAVSFVAYTLRVFHVPYRRKSNHPTYQPTQQLVHIPSENPRYPGFELEADMVEQLQKIRRRQQRMMARGEI
ncbi:MAG: helix-turn-helix domain containing protein [Thermoguttaceae bacterium]|nr:helix-turn-helix domain containing protein [Thermoguttaceae bacterium]